MHRDKIDKIDITIMEVLQERGRAKRNELAEMVGASLPTISERLIKLEELGYIKGIHAALDNRRLGLEITAFVTVTTDLQTKQEEIEKLTQKNPFVQECHYITGEGTYLLKVRAGSMEQLEKTIREVHEWKGAINTTTSIALSTLKETTYLPLTHLVKNAEDE